MYEPLLRSLRERELLSSEEAEKIAVFESKRPFSLHWELKTLLYLGVLLLNIGLGYLIYEHIDSIGHAVIIALIGAISAGCFWYTLRHRLPFSKGELKSPTPFFEYIFKHSNSMDWMPVMEKDRFGKIEMKLPQTDDNSAHWIATPQQATTRATK